jgi:Family of unknown function (DUF5871)
MSTYDTMDFGSIIKVPDGRYYLKVTGSKARVQLNKITVTDFSQKPITLKLTSKQIDSVRAIEEQILKQASLSSKEWFGREISDPTLIKAFQSSISPDGTMDVSLLTAGGKTRTTFWDNNKQAKDMGSEWNTVDLIVDLTGVWFLKKSYGPIFKVLQVKESTRMPQHEYLFEDCDDEDPTDYID